MDEEIICHKCGESISYKALFCGYCGAELRGLEAMDDQTMYVTHKDDTLPNMQRNRRAYFAPHAELALHLVETDEEVICDLSHNSITLGRKHHPDPDDPYLDLSPYDASSQGVSRKHARIARLNATVMIQDLGALNGTFVNSHRIAASEPCILCDGDEIRLGNFVMEVLFKN